MAQVTLFADANYSGASQVLSVGRYDFADRTLAWNDALSSLRVPAGLIARLYEHSWFQGRYVDIGMDTPALPAFWNDRASSIIVYATTDKGPVITTVVVFEHAGYNGASQLLSVGRFDGAKQQLKLNQSINSALVPRGMLLRLYDGPDCTGAFVNVLTDVDAVSMDWNDRAKSVAVMAMPAGLAAQSTLNAGVIGESSGFDGVLGVSHADWHAGVLGINDSTTGLQGPGVRGQGTGTGVWGESTGWVGVFGVSQSTTGGSGVWGEHRTSGAGVVAISKTGAGLYAKGGRVAASFDGDVEVSGDIRLINADRAEDFTIGTTTPVEPGTVMVLRSDGTLVPSERPYDKRVAGVVSGAGDYKPGIVLDKRASDVTRQPVALLGKVYCKADARYGAIAAGDLLTTSPTLGHAMKAAHPAKAFGAVIGKALAPLETGAGLVPVLIALQ
jgi:hypothetical protein